jgi:hypothetical protein
MGWNFGCKEQCSRLPQYQPNTCHLSVRREENESCIGWEMHRHGSGMYWIGRRTENGSAVF